MAEPLVPIRLRVAADPRRARPAATPSRPARRAVLVHVESGPGEEMLRAVAIELLDGRATQVFVVGAEGDDAVSWAERVVLAGAGGLPVVPRVGTARQLGRYITQRCGERGLALVVFDAGHSLGRLAGYTRHARRGDALSVTLAGCGWRHHATGAWCDSDFRARLALALRGSDRGVLARWLPPRRPGRRRKRAAGPIVQLDVLGAALGCAVTDMSRLATSCGAAWPEGASGLDQLLGEALALLEAYAVLLDDLGELAPGLRPEHCWSAASLVSDALRRAGVPAPEASLSDLDPRAIGAAAASLHGGRVEALLVGLATTMTLVDLNGTYLRLFSLLDLTRHLAAARFTAVERDGSELVALLRRADLRHLLDDRTLWALLACQFAVVRPDGRAALPVQRRAGARWRSVLAPLELLGGTYVVSVLDLIGPALAGRLPPVECVLEITPVGLVESLAAVRLPSGRTIDLAEGDLGTGFAADRSSAATISDPVRRARREAVAKGGGVAGSWGLYGRVDRLAAPREASEVVTDADGNEQTIWHHPHRALVGATGPAGERLAISTTRPDESGPLCLWHLGAAVPAACRALLALTEHDIRSAGGVVAATMTDALLVPSSANGELVACPGGDHELPDGTAAIYLLARDELARILTRSDSLLCPEGARAWKEEAGSLSGERIGLVLGLNKVLLGKSDKDGTVRLVRSSDTALGEHFLDPTGTGDRLDDGRSSWAAALEEDLLREAVASGHLHVPDELASWASEQPALRPGRASSWSELVWLRRELGDATLGPFATYVTAATGGAAAPICLGSGRPPATWRSWPWRVDGAPARIAILAETGELDVSEGAGPIVVAHTLRDVLAGWIAENDPTVIGPKRGLRHVAPVRSHTALVELVGRSGEHAGELDPDEPLSFGTRDVELVADARRLGSAALAAGGIAPRTAKRLASGRATPSRATLTRLASVLADGPHRRRCASCGAEISARARADARYCSASCRQRSHRSSRALAGRGAA